MKYILCISLLLPVQLFAQNTDSVKHGIGLFAEMNTGFNSGQNASMTTMGLQYTKKTKGPLSYNISLAYGNYENRPLPLAGFIKGDTVYGRSVGHNIDLAVVGFGLEVQHQFYRKLYFFSGLQLRLGYGSGNTDTAIMQQYNYSGPNPAGTSNNGVVTYETNERGPSATMFYAGLTPYFGLKLEFKRFVIGTSFMNYFTVQSLNVKGGGEGNGTEAGFDLSNLSQRFFITYKF